ncbi:hypothetical protein BDY21DRAFT_343828 [Lineolata rhizophorae]|uniref:Uncharacterized protein n=1 Tax=Lineolata rhizophorae TaxID=578093 RepID=A0A6A6P121_9PEZI|nr:hypothetical protein BDY21DRAFT_343828 [Lineolata rhizophorae]
MAVRNTNSVLYRYRPLIGQEDRLRSRARANRHLKGDGPLHCVQLPRTAIDKRANALWAEESPFLQAHRTVVLFRPFTAPSGPYSTHDLCFLGAYYVCSIATERWGPKKESDRTGCFPEERDDCRSAPGPQMWLANRSGLLGRRRSRGTPPTSLVMRLRPLAVEGAAGRTTCAVAHLISTLINAQTSECNIRTWLHRSAETGRTKGLTGQSDPASGTQPSERLEVRSKESIFCDTTVPGSSKTLSPLGLSKHPAQNEYKY